MFDNIGTKIKSLAVILCWIGIIVSVVVGLFLISDYQAGLGIILLIGGPIISWIGSFFVYGFGQLIENTDKLVSIHGNKKGGEKHRKASSSKQNEKKHTENGIEYVDFPCPVCGEDLSFEKEYVISAKTLICPLCENEFETKTVL